MENPLGSKWQPVEPPGGVIFKQISVGKAGIWTVDTTGRLSVRKEITATFPEGSHWQLLSNIQNDPPHYEGNIGFKNVSVGEHVMAVSQSGYICKRSGISPDNPAGTGWTLGIQVCISTCYVSEQVIFFNFILGKLALCKCKWVLRLNFTISTHFQRHNHYSKAAISSDYLTDTKLYSIV